MKVKLEEELISIVQADAWMIEILKITRDLQLKDSWIGAGFIRNKVWDVKHNLDRTELNDIDVIFYDEKYAKDDEKKIENNLRAKNPNVNWSVKNQARMNIRNGHEPYLNCQNSISFWPETATAVAVRINETNKIECIAPYGLTDLFELIVKPTPNFSLPIYLNRIKEKRWIDRWEKLKIK